MTRRKKGNKQEILSPPEAILNMRKDILFAIQPSVCCSCYVVVFFLPSAFSKETGTVGKLKTSVLIPLFCWINIHTCHGSKILVRSHPAGVSHADGVFRAAECEHGMWRNSPTGPERDSSFFINEKISNSYSTMIVVMRGWFSVEVERGSSSEKKEGEERFLNTFAFGSEQCRSIERCRNNIEHCCGLTTAEKRWNSISDSAYAISCSSGGERILSLVGVEREDVSLNCLKRDSWVNSLAGLIIAFSVGTENQICQ